MNNRAIIENKVRGRTNDSEVLNKPTVEQINEIYTLAKQKNYTTSDGMARSQYKELAEGVIGKSYVEDMPQEECECFIYTLRQVSSLIVDADSRHEVNQKGDGRIKSLIILLTIVSCFMQLFGMGWFSNLEVYKIILFTIGSVSLFIGCYYWVKLKNLTWFYSFLGLLNFIRLLVIGLLHSKATTNINRVKQDKLVLCVALSVIGFVLLIISIASITGNLYHEVISRGYYGFHNTYGELAIKPAWFSNWVLLPALAFLILTGAITTSLYVWKRISSKSGS